MCFDIDCPESKSTLFTLWTKIHVLKKLISGKDHILTVENYIFAVRIKEELTYN